MAHQNFDLAAARHTAAHILAAASTKLKPDTKLGVGPAIADGFYHDIDVQEHYTADDLPRLQAEMEKIVDMDLPITQREVTKAEARQLFAHDPYKLELIDEITEDTVGVSEMGDGFFITLCRGGHAASTGKIGAFTLTRLAGVYWKGVATNPQLQRIYGLLFPTRKELAVYLHQQTEAKKRDHKVLGPQLGLFAFSPLVGPGLPLFLPKGAAVVNQLEQFVRQEKEKRGYRFVIIPHIAKTALYAKSGHLGKYDAMMPTMTDADGDAYVLKPMSCPHHFAMYNAQPHSYKDLPLRLAETTTVYRNEKSGELSGLVRVKSLTQDDTHHFVRHDQIEAEIAMILDLMDTVYRTFNFSDYRVQISVRDPQQPDKYFGDNALWESSERYLIEAVQRWGRPYEVVPGEAAFYGPKIDIMVKDSLGREWQLTTLQLDFNQPENFQLRYTGEDGKEHAPAVLHVAILGSLERFLGILIEHYAGAFPLWLAPVQVTVAPIAQDQLAYAEEVATTLTDAGLRVEIDRRAQSIGKKIREAQVQKIPYTLIIGKKEVAENVVAIRSREKGDEGTIELSALIEKLTDEITTKQ